MKKELLDQLATRQKLKLNLLRFDGGDGADGGDNGDQGDDKSGDGKGDGKTFTQQQLANAAAAQVKAREAELEAQHQAEIERIRKEAREEGKTEAKKYADMTEEERKQADWEKKEKEMADKERIINERELRAEAKDTLIKEELPLKLADVLDYSDSETLNNSITSVKEAFNAAVTSEVDKRIASSAHEPGGSGSGSKKPTVGSRGKALAEERKKNQSKKESKYFTN